ncbi:AidA/PixA family protein [Streptomyces sp. NPDC057702]|uniref:AidA/PixA family protein n=1 Tax=unclassified Streptomyces TaxID=2593676 RepID=UPI0036B12C43
MAEDAGGGKASRRIDVLVVFDAESIVARYENPSRKSDAPTWVDEKYVHIPPLAGALSPPASGVVRIDAEPGDVVRWQETSIALDSSYAVLMYHCRNVSGQGLASGFSAEIHPVQVPYPDPRDEGDTHFATQEFRKHAWDMRVTGRGVGVFEFFFQVLNRDAEVLGYFLVATEITFGQ